MKELSAFCHTVLKTNPEQVQIFTPSPSTVSTMMYYAGKDFSGKNVFSEHVPGLKERQKEIVVGRRKRS